MKVAIIFLLQFDFIRYPADTSTIDVVIVKLIWKGQNAVIASKSKYAIKLENRN